MSATEKDKGSEHLLLATFFLQNAIFGIDAKLVQEIVKVGDITPVHHAPPLVLGIRNLRGRIVTVIDMAIRLELGCVEQGNDSRLLIMEYNDEPIGFLVDQVRETIQVSLNEVLPPPPSLYHIQHRFLQGVCKDAGHLVGILDPELLLQIEEEDTKTFAERKKA